MADKPVDPKDELAADAPGDETQAGPPAERKGIEVAGFVTQASPGTVATEGERISPAPITKFGSVKPSEGLKNAAGITWRILLLIVGLLVLLKIVGLLGGVAMALFFAMVITALGGPIHRFLTKFLPNAAGAILTILFMLFIVSGVLSLIVTSIVSEAGNLVSAASNGLNQIEEWLQTGPLHMDEGAIAGLVEKSQHWLQGVGTDIAKDIPSTLGSFGDFVTAASVFVFGAFFFLSSGNKVWQWFMSWIPEHIRDEVDNCGHVAWISLSGYTRGLIIVAIADGILVYIGLVILGIPLAPVLAVIVMFGALIPVIGAPVATMFAAIVALADKGVWYALAVVALTVIVGSFDGDIMQPLIMGKAVQLHPLAIVSAIAFGTLSFGIVGALLAVPLTATLYSMAKYLTGRMPAPKDTEDERKPRKPFFLRRAFHREEQEAPA